VCHLAIEEGQIEAKVSGSELYTVQITIKTLPGKKWKDVKRRCIGQIGSLIELLQGNLSESVMEVVTDRRDGLFPQPGEISLNCSCPDWAAMCKHVAAVLYGVGARLDRKPELLFKLRGVDHEELITADAEAAVSAATTSGKSKRLAAGDLSDVFGIDLDAADSKEGSSSVSSAKAKRPARKPARKKAAGKSDAAAATKARKAKKRPKATKKKASATSPLPPGES
ncbi:MAG: SWIM zinc finger family protein, partial [Thermoguttaceae bacterium]